MEDFPFLAKLRASFDDVEASSFGRARSRRLAAVGARPKTIVVAAVVALLGLALPLAMLTKLGSDPAQQQLPAGQTGVEHWALRSGTPMELSGDEPQLSSTRFNVEPGIQAIASASGSIWVVGYQSVARLDEVSGSIIAQIDLSSDDGSLLAPVGNHVWASDGVRALTDIDASTNSVLNEREVGGNILGLASLDGEIWVSIADGSLLELDGTSGEQLNHYDLGVAGPLTLASGGLWVLSDSTSYRVDPSTGTVTTNLAGTDSPVVESGGLLWSVKSRVGVEGNSLVVGVDPSTGETQASFAIPRAFSLAASPVGLWVYALPGSTSDELYLPDPNQPAKAYLISSSQEIVGQAEVDPAPARTTAAGGSLWISASETGRVTRVDS
jgi:PQQ-like domain